MYYTAMAHTGYLQLYVSRESHWYSTDIQLYMIICDRPRQNQPYCAGYRSEIQAYLVAQGDNYHFSHFGIDR